MSEIKFSTGSGGNNMSVDGKKAGKRVLAGIIVIAALILAYNCFTSVPEGFIGVKYQFGKIVQDNMSAGLNFKVPFVEEIQKVDIRNQIYSVTVEAYTSDTQTVKDLVLKLNYCYDPTKLSQIIREIGVGNIDSKIVSPNVSKITKNEIGKTKAEVLVQTRSSVQQAIEDELREVLAKDGIMVTAFALENLNFDSAFEESIQAKVIAAQEALRTENKTREREEEAKQVVIKAQADADSVEISAAAQAKAIQLIQEQLAKSPSYIEYLKITNWNGILPQVIGDGVNPFVVLGSDNTAANSNNAVPSQAQTE